MLVLEEYERAKARSATIYAEVHGLGQQLRRLLGDQAGPGGPRRRPGDRRRRSTEAEVDHRDVDYINAHGTSTRLNDAMETAAVKRVFGEHAQDVPLSSIKSMIGHSIGASRRGRGRGAGAEPAHAGVPADDQPDAPRPACDLDYVPNTAREAKVKYGLSTSFGFGGQNGALVMAAV